MPTPCSWCNRLAYHCLQTLFSLGLFIVVKNPKNITFLKHENLIHHLQINWAPCFWFPTLKHGSVRKLQYCIFKKISAVLYPDSKALHTSNWVRLYFLHPGVICHAFEIYARMEVLELFLILLDRIAYITSLFNLSLTISPLSIIVQS